MLKTTILAFFISILCCDGLGQSVVKQRTVVFKYGVEFYVEKDAIFSKNRRNNHFIVSRYDLQLNHLASDSIKCSDKEFLYNPNLKELKEYHFLTYDKQKQVLRLYVWQNGKLTLQGSKSFTEELSKLEWSSDLVWVKFKNGKNGFYSFESGSFLKNPERCDCASSDVVFDEGRNQFYAVQLSSDNQVLRLQVFDKAGGQITESEISTRDSKYYFNDFHISAGPDSNVVLNGTYRVDDVNGSNGFFIASFEDENWDFVKLLDFDKFESFVRTKKLPFDAKRQKVKDKERLNTDMRVEMLSHQVVFTDSLYYLVGEVYYEKFRTEFYYDNRFGYPTQSSNVVSDGFHFTHAVICGINYRGEKFTDFNQEIDILSSKVRKQMQFIMNDHQIHLLEYKLNGVQFYQLAIDNFNALNEISFDFYPNGKLKSSATDYLLLPNGQILYFGPRVINYKNQVFPEKRHEAGLITW